jgi:hypothetical protein
VISRVRPPSVISKEAPREAVLYSSPWRRLRNLLSDAGDPFGTTYLRTAVSVQGRYAGPSTCRTRWGMSAAGNGFAVMSRR